MVARVVPQSARRRHAESRKPDLREGNNPENQNLAVWFCVRPGPTPFFAFGTPARFRVTGAASCGHYAAGAAGKKNCRPPPLI